MFRPYAINVPSINALKNTSVDITAFYRKHNTLDTLEELNGGQITQGLKYHLALIIEHGLEGAIQHIRNEVEYPERVLEDPLDRLVETVCGEDYYSFFDER